MITGVLRRLEALEADLAAIDPEHHADAADRVAAMAVALRDTLAATRGLEARDASAEAAVG